MKVTRDKYNRLCKKLKQQPLAYLRLVRCNNIAKLQVFTGDEIWEDIEIEDENK